MKKVIIPIFLFLMILAPTNYSQAYVMKSKNFNLSSSPIFTYSEGTADNDTSNNTAETANTSSVSTTNSPSASSSPSHSSGGSSASNLNIVEHNNQTNVVDDGQKTQEANLNSSNAANNQITNTASDADGTNMQMIDIKDESLATHQQNIVLKTDNNNSITVQQKYKNTAHIDQNVTLQDKHSYSLPIFVRAIYRQLKTFYSLKFMIYETIHSFFLCII